MPAKTRTDRLKTLLFWLLTAILLITSAYLLFARLGDALIADYDEARHGVNAYEMIRNQDYIVTTYQGQADFWNLKPPLSAWLIAFSYGLFGYNAFALRFFSALATFLCEIAVAYWAARHINRWAVPLLLLLFVSNARFYGLHFSRAGDADAQYQLFFTLAMLGMLNAEHDFRWFYASALFFGLAFLEKGLHALNIPIICLITLIGTGRIRQLNWKRALGLLACGLGLILPWAVARYSRDGMAFFTHMFSTDVAGRIGSTADPLDPNQPALLYYIDQTFRYPMLCAYLALCALSAAVLKITGARLTPWERNTVIGCSVWTVVPFVFYTLMNVKYNWYVYSILMALPLLTAVLFFAMLRAAPANKAVWGIVGVGFVIFVLFTAQNVIHVSQVRFNNTVQAFLQQNLDRDSDSGRHAYIQYNENGQTAWMQADMLTALYYGDVTCMDGGVEAFMNDKDSAVLFVGKEDNAEAIAALQEQEIVRNEDYYLIAFDNE
ncbi:MAG TPA: glycosyltransferase family 39 protein [Candidatus Limiplasma sp.]|nr:glycosyltransferase family 39 protein [Candidatus Limiplasma sp.]HPS80869.1 glycosyltransferase family 39 protein [Candidatus Limiplasma sp.]